MWPSRIAHRTHGVVSTCRGNVYLCYYCITNSLTFRFRASKNLLMPLQMRKSQSQLTESWRLACRQDFSADARRRPRICSSGFHPSVSTLSRGQTLSSHEQSYRGRTEALSSQPTFEMKHLRGSFTHGPPVRSHSNRSAHSAMMQVSKCVEYCCTYYPVKVFTLDISNRIWLICLAFYIEK